MDAKIQELIDQKFWMLLRQSEASMKLFGGSPPNWHGNKITPTVISSCAMSKKEQKDIMREWSSYIKQLGITRVSAPRYANKNVYVLDPATNWFMGFPSRLSRRRRHLYVKIPREFAFKILALGLL